MSKAEKLKSYLPRYYNESKQMNEKCDTTGIEFDLIFDSIKDVMQQCFPQTATWGLKYWEEFLDIPVNKLDKDKNRRAKIITKLTRNSPMTPYEMKKIISNFADEVILKEFPKESRFEVILKTKTTIHGILSSVIDEIEDAKPAHLDYSISIDYLSEYIIQKIFSKWFSEKLNECGTTDVSGNLSVATDGWRFKANIVIVLNNYFSEKFMVASEETYTIGFGYSIIKDILNLFYRFFSEPFLIASESTYSTAQGFRFNTELIDKIDNYLTDPMPVCSENLFSIGGELVYDS